METKETTTIKAGEAKGKRKILRKFGTFLMYGGWILVVIVIVAIIIAVSTLTRGG